MELLNRPCKWALTEADAVESHEDELGIWPDFEKMRNIYISSNSKPLTKHGTFFKWTQKPSQLTGE